MQLLTSGKQDMLEAQGFEIAELTGFDRHSIPLYAHHPLGDKKPGDVVLHVRVGNPESLDDGEANYLARKAFHGMFPWLPGAECIKRSFVTMNVVGGSGSTEQSAKAKGCRWCRDGKQAQPTQGKKKRTFRPRSLTPAAPDG